MTFQSKWFYGHLGRKDSSKSLSSNKDYSENESAFNKDEHWMLVKPTINTKAGHQEEAGMVEGDAAAWGYQKGQVTTAGLYTCRNMIGHY